MNNFTIFIAFCLLIFVALQDCRTALETEFQATERNEYIRAAVNNLVVLVETVRT